MKIKMCDPSGLLLSLSGIVLGVLLAVAEYRVDFWAALVLIVTAGLIHAYMQTLNKWWMAASVAGAVLTVWLSYGTLFSLESLILLLFAYFIIRLARGMGGRGRISDGVLTCLLYALQTDLCSRRHGIRVRPPEESRARRLRLP